MVSHTPSWMRNGWIWLIPILAALIAGFVAGLGAFGIPSYGVLIFCLLFAVIVTKMSDFYVIARAGDEIVLATKSRWTNKVLGIAERYDSPLAASINKKWFQSFADVDGRVLGMQKGHTDRFEMIVD